MVKQLVERVARQAPDLLEPDPLGLKGDTHKEEVGKQTIHGPAHGLSPQYLNAVKTVLEA